jgi:predicted dienelactone hydrolase
VRQITQLLAALALVSSSVAAGAAPPSVPAADAPVLAALGPHGVGAATISVPTGTKAGSRTLRVVLWYPAAAQTGATPIPIPYRHRLEPPPPLTALEVSTEALAVRDAAPARGKFPLVIVSHGYRGWPESMSYITENLASKGYVVAGIDHGDRPFTDAAGFGASFALTASTRARDQQAVLAHLAGPASAAGHKLGRAIDTDRVALIGYSMGGFGALATAGAGYDPQSPAYRSLPAGALSDQAEGRREPDRRIRAVVAIAPWGAQPPHRAWSAASMKRLRAPLMVIAAIRMTYRNMRTESAGCSTMRRDPTAAFCSTATPATMSAATRCRRRLAACSSIARCSRSRCGAAIASTRSTSISSPPS